MEAHRKIPDCPVEMTLQLIGDKWKVLIIRDLMSGTKRFNELMRSVTGITQKVLTSHLRAMEQDGLLTRKVYPEVGTVKSRSEGCQDLVRFFALLRIKPHAPPLVRVPVNSFEFHSCERTPQVEYLMRLRRHQRAVLPDT